MTFRDCALVFGRRRAALTATAVVVAYFPDSRHFPPLSLVLSREKAEHQKQETAHQLQGNRSNNSLQTCLLVKLTPQPPRATNKVTTVSTKHPTRQGQRQPSSCHARNTAAIPATTLPMEKNLKPNDGTATASSATHAEALPLSKNARLSDSLNMTVRVAKIST
jgi:hypothetical protein